MINLTTKSDDWCIAGTWFTWHELNLDQKQTKLRVKVKINGAMVWKKLALPIISFSWRLAAI